MKKAAACFVCLILCRSGLQAQSKAELFGYFESQIIGTQLKDDFFQLFSNKLRLDLKSSLSDNITFAANVNFMTYHGKTTWNILDFLPEKASAEVSPGMEELYILPFNDRIFLDNAYLKLSFKRFDLTAGKQQISMGTGYIWNPTDVFNIKDFLDPTYEQPGHNALRLDIPVSHSTTLTALYAPDDSLKNSAKMLLFKSRISHFDISLVGIEKVWRFHDYTQFDVSAQNFVELPGKRQLLGAGTAGELLGLGIWAEFAYNWMETSDNFYELVVGSDYTFDFQTYVLVEYYRNTLGKSDYTEYSLNDWMRMMAMEQKTIAGDQVYAFIKHPVSDFVSLGCSAVFCISDNSLALVPLLNWSFSDNVEVLAYLNFNLGKEGKIFAQNMGNAGLIRARIYF
ncbi:MAG: hypothetical protein JXB26_16540 [Candidatus Aminicenantes bacterium]|nr:hypothetical protein [Candidatus Aminicenantes bacterium]